MYRSISLVLGLSSFRLSRSCPARCGPEHIFRGAPVLCFGLGATTGKSGKSCLCFWPTMGMGSLWYLVVEVDDHGKCMGISLQIQVDG